MLKGSIYWSHMNLEIHRSTKEENVFLDLIGDLDMAGAPILRQAIAQEVSPVSYTHLTLPTTPYV